jgi:hypothetical protein
MLALREHGELVQVFGQSRCRLGDVNKAVLDEGGLRVQSHNLVDRRLIARNAMTALGDQILDQLGA